MVNGYEYRNIANDRPRCGYYLEPLLLRWDIHFGFRQFYAALRPAYRIFNYALLALLTLIFLANILLQRWGKDIK